MVTNMADGYEVEVTQGREHVGETGAYRLVPTQDVLFALILWYVAKSIFRS